jgi:3-deoxy-manno-octulosonate cytidylyltransferase (CMP-KDO synthetase)
MSSFSTAIIVPMRIASTRLPGKQHQLIGDRPLIYYVLDNVLKTKVKNIFVACDDPLHFDLISKYGKVEAIMTSPELMSGSDRINEAANILENRGQSFDLIVNVQGDMPFFDPKIVDATINMMEQNPQFDIGTCAVRSSDPDWVNPPSHVKVVFTKKGNALYFSRAVIPVDAKEANIHVGIYAYHRAALSKYSALPQSELELKERLEQLRALENGMQIGVCMVDSLPLSVDTPQDLELAREYYKKLQSA